MQHQLPFDLADGRSDQQGHDFTWGQQKRRHFQRWYSGLMGHGHLPINARPSRSGNIENQLPPAWGPWAESVNKSLTRGRNRAGKAGRLDGLVSDTPRNDGGTIGSDRPVAAIGHHDRSRDVAG